MGVLRHARIFLSGSVPAKSAPLVFPLKVLGERETKVRKPLALAEMA